MLCTLTPGPCIRDIFTHLGIPEAADDPRFATAEAVMKNWAEASGMIVTAFAKRPFTYWLQHLKTMRAQWAPDQSMLDLSTDEQALANDMIVEVEATDGGGRSGWFDRRSSSITSPSRRPGRRRLPSIPSSSCSRTWASTGSGSNA